MGEGVVIGNSIVASSVLSEVALLRLAGGLRWAGALRAAAVTRSLTRGGVEGELIGARAGWQTYRGLSAREALKVSLPRLGADLTAQMGANYIGSRETGIYRAWDSFIGVNLIETSMAVYGLRPVGIGVGSAFLQLSIKDGFQSPLNHQVSWKAFGAQALIGATGGYAGQVADNLLSKRLAYRLYYQAALRVGPTRAYPAWLGGAHLFRTGIPSAIGITEEHLENLAQEQYPVVLPAADSTSSIPSSQP